MKADVSAVLGIDTSNYTCSAAYFDSHTYQSVQAKKLLPVKSGEKGIRQSDAVFHHTILLPQMLEELGSLCANAAAIGVSDRPSCRERSYMPCFMVGLAVAKAASAVSDIPYYTTTHQMGHILAALYSADKLDWLRSEQRFFAFHVSGGTTDLLLCDYSGDDLLNIRRVGGSSDLKAGQAIDRCGVMLGLDFPCGRELEKLAVQCGDSIKIRPSVNGTDCSLSGIENKCKQLFDRGADKSYIAKYCIMSVEAAISTLSAAAVSEYGELPILYAGGVMSDKLIADSLKTKFECSFAAPEFSCDNAVGVAVYAALKKGWI